ncbi:hypothetical protein C9I89_13720 [Photobacterium lipolyticum]|uniref:Uncharacterized protein n=1 Tax=Photobacterium lipolyticum TaxID=266810 RepID=A0A2T3MX10_9GAMM|nr:hypothetical protein C9I89_13720 [Photobacterium lipolyticum]
MQHSQLISVKKISKSGFTLRLESLIDKGYAPMAYRYLTLTSQLNFNDTKRHFSLFVNCTFVR